MDADKINMEELSKRLLALGQYGCHLRGIDGHIWVEPFFYECDVCEGTHSDLHRLLKRCGLSLSNKIYGEVLEALDTIDEALKLSEQPSLLEGFPGWKYDDPLFLGSPGTQEHYIIKCDVGTGGLR